MEQNSKIARLHALDGLRGLAIIMVFLSHINAGNINRTNLLGAFFLNSGVIGVSFLFILSGFLMAFLYPQPKSKQAFIQKRYTRIFPLFLTACSALFILKFINIDQWYIKIGIFLLFAILVHFVWVYGIKRYLNHRYTKILFFCFIFFQFCVCLYYLWVMQHQPIYYYQQMPLLTRSLTDWFVNATLTLPIGKYVNMIDPVYWSLAAEVLFYILYPFFCVPIIAYMSQKSKKSRIILLLCLLPFFAGIAILSQHILYLSLLRFQLFFYFVTGMTLGYLYRKYPHSIIKIGKFFPGILSHLTIILLIGIIFFEHIVEMTIPGDPIWKQLIFALPFTFLVAIALANNTTLAKLLRSRILVYIGTVSYSIYLSHMFILSLAISITGQPNSLLATFCYILLTFIATVIFSSILYFLLERPYFIRKKEEKKIAFDGYKQNKYVPAYYSTLALVIIVAVFSIYQNNINFFTLRESFNNSIRYPQKNNSFISLQQYPHVSLEFIAHQNNFGVLNLHFVHQSLPNKKFIPQQIELRIKQKNSKNWFSSSQYAISGSSDTLPDFYGFPLIATAKNKIFDVLISQTVPTSSEYVLLDTAPNKIVGIYFVDKKSLIKNPDNLLNFVENKIQTVIENTEAKYVLLLFFPSILFAFYLLATNKKSRGQIKTGSRI
jgi:peptidoglycan/LPS O-acetylase OafA/YrhL